MKIFNYQAMFYRMGIIALIVGGSLLQARVTSVKRVSRFERKITNPKYRLSVVMFYWYAKAQRSQKDRKYTKDAKNSFKDVSNTKRYRNAKVKFIRVNLSKASALAPRYGVSDNPQEITFLLFQDGSPHKKGVVRVVLSELTPRHIRDLIEGYFGDRIDNIIKEREKERERRYQRRRYRYYYGYPYGYYGYDPYYRYPYGYGGFGFGRRFGHGRHRGHGGHRGGHRGHGGHRGGHRGHGGH